jgi:YidC/Oxa1 family membrane protein insertase
MSIITVPFSRLLLLLYQPVQSFGIAIILFALVVKLIMLPFQLKSKRSMMRMNSLAPLVKELEKKHGGNKQKYQQEVAKLYQDEKINPMSGCLWSIIPFPILIALYSVVRAPLTHVMRLTSEQIDTLANLITAHGVELSTGAYRELAIAGNIAEYYDELSAAVPGVLNLNFQFLGMNLCDFPQLNFFAKVNWADIADWGPALGLFLIPFISAFLSWLLMKVTNSGQQVAPEQANMMRSMNLMMPLMSVYICFIMPAAMGIYWIANSVFAIIQELVVNSHFKKVLDAEAADREARIAARMAEEEKKRAEAAERKAAGEIDRSNTSKRRLEAQSRNREAERKAAERRESGEKADKKGASQVGTRRYARGRAYEENRYAAETENDTIDETAPAADQTESAAGAEPAAEE